MTANRKKLLRIVTTVILVAISLSAFDIRLKVRRYTLDAPEITSAIRMVLITDLHSCRYGDMQSTLIDAVNDLKPDLVLLGGDIFDDDLPDENTDIFLSGIKDLYPCYYVTGNHEYWSGSERYSEKMAILEKYGINTLSGECVTVSVNGEFINICGVDDPEAFWEEQREENVRKQLISAKAGADNGCYTILLAHRPEYFDTYCEYDFDLVLSGHAHGGQWRIPLILNGLYAPNQGIFPEYAGGQYEADDTTMIVSRGLARKSTRVPRIFNRPELVLIEIE